MSKTEKIIITFNPIDNSVCKYLSDWVTLINNETEKKRLEQLRADRKAKIKEIFKNI
jgi:hypothetical protein